MPRCVHRCVSLPRQAREPAADVNEGDYLLAVNGQKVDTSEDPWAAFQGLAGEVVTLTINSKPDNLATHAGPAR